MQVIVFRESGLKMPIHAPKIAVLGDMTTQIGSSMISTPKGTFFTHKDLCDIYVIKILPPRRGRCDLKNKII